MNGKKKRTLSEAPGDNRENLTEKNEVVCVLYYIHFLLCICEWRRKVGIELIEFFRNLNEDEKELHEGMNELIRNDARG